MYDPPPQPPRKFIYISIYFGHKTLFSLNPMKHLTPQALETPQTIWNNPISHWFINFGSLSPLRKCWVIIMRMTHEIQMSATGTIFIVETWGRIIKSIYNLVSHWFPCNSSHNVVNHAIGIMEAFSNVNIVAKLLAKLQEVESSCRYTYNGIGGVIMWMKITQESTKIVSSSITSE